MDAADISANAVAAQRLTHLRDHIERHLDVATPGGPSPEKLSVAMRYCLLAPAKRARAILTLLTAVHCGGTKDQATSAAVAIEMVHASSLILDDLPAMDDAAMRRGRDTCHRAFGEATAVLAAIALMNRAYAVVALDTTLTPEQRALMAVSLTTAIGTDGLTGGQEGDLHGIALSGTAGVEWIHARKTGALFAAATQMGAIAAGAAGRSDALADFGMKLGLAFQTYDDLLDARASGTAIGKDTGRDTAKATLVQLLGFDAALARADDLMGHARALVPDLDRADGMLGHYVAALVEQMRRPLGVSVTSVIP